MVMYRTEIQVAAHILPVATSGQWHTDSGLTVLDAGGNITVLNASDLWIKNGLSWA